MARMKKAQNHEEVRRSGHRPLEQLLLPEHLDGLPLERGAGALGDALDPVGRGLTAGDDAVEERDPSAASGSATTFISSPMMSTASTSHSQAPARDRGCVRVGARVSEWRRADVERRLPTRNRSVTSDVAIPSVGRARPERVSMAIGADLSAWMMQKCAPFTVHYGRGMARCGADLPAPSRIRVPTRHGRVRVPRAPTAGRAGRDLRAPPRRCLRDAPPEDGRLLPPGGRRRGRSHRDRRRLRRRAPGEVSRRPGAGARRARPCEQPRVNRVGRPGSRRGLLRRRQPGRVGGAAGPRPGLLRPGAAAARGAVARRRRGRARQARRPGCPLARSRC